MFCIGAAGERGRGEGGEGGKVYKCSTLMERGGREQVEWKRGFRKRESFQPLASFGGTSGNILGFRHIAKYTIQNERGSFTIESLWQLIFLHNGANNHQLMNDKAIAYMCKLCMRRRIWEDCTASQVATQQRAIERKRT